MEISAMRGSVRGCALIMPDMAVMEAAICNGIDFSRLRSVLLVHLASSVRLEVINDNGCSEPAGDIEDFRCLWGWVPVMSARARDLAVALGSPENEFLPCRISSSTDIFFFHAPEKIYDIVDFERSTFDVMLSSNPQVFHGLRRLCLKGASSPLPPCMRALATPSMPQALAELLVTREFKKAWQSKRFSGADFRDVM